MPFRCTLMISIVATCMTDNQRTASPPSLQPGEEVYYLQSRVAKPLRSQILLYIISCLWVTRDYIIYVAMQSHPLRWTSFRPIPGLISVFTMRRGRRSRFQAYVHSRLPSLGTRLTHDVMFTHAKTGARLFQTITEHFSSLGRSSHGFYPHSGHGRE